MKIEAICAGSIGENQVFTRRANDGIFFILPKNEDVFDGCVYSLELKQENAKVDLNPNGKIKFLAITATTVAPPKMERSITGKKLHIDILKRKERFSEWAETNKS